MEEPKVAKFHFTIPSDVTKELVKLAQERGLEPQDALTKFIRLGMWLSTFKTGQVTVYVRREDGSEEKVYPVT